MVIITQDKHIVAPKDIVLNGSEISCNEGEKRVLGSYEDQKRAQEIYSEIVFSGWNEKSIYQMPEA